jgi:hypothetical protein
MAQVQQTAQQGPQTATATAVRLTLRNPSPYKRRGMVVVPWQPIAAKLGNPLHARVLFDHGFGGSLAPLDTQVDRLDPNDPTRDELVFRVDEPISAGDEDYQTPCGSVVVEGANAPQTSTSGLKADAAYDGVALTHDKLYVWLNTSVSHDSPNNPWFGGALACVRHDNRDLLDPIAEDLGFELDLDRRAAQIDRIHFVRPPWDEEGSFDQDVFNNYWKCVSTSAGPLRALATIESAPFKFLCRDADQTIRTFTCRVHRTLGILNGSDLITDKIWVTGDVEGPTPPVPMWFSARYFMLVNLSLGSITFRYPDHPGWFAVLAQDTPVHHGYAFATDSYAGPIWHPPLVHKDKSTRHRAYSWELGARRLANAVHLLRRDTTTQSLTDAIGWAWYDLMYKPLRATL